MKRKKIRKAVRDAVAWNLLAYARRTKAERSGPASDLTSLLPVRVTLTRISPGTLDEWDGLPASLKSTVDGIADAFGLRDDDPRFTWEKPLQRKNGRGVFAVEIQIMPRDAAKETGT